MLTKELPDIPIVPPQIIEAVNNNSLAIFIGAGVSRLAGCKGWADLAWGLVNLCFNKKLINFREQEKLSGSTDHKKTISIAYHLLEKNGFEDDFYNVFNKAILYGDGFENKMLEENIYDKIIQIPATYISTNADQLFCQKRFFLTNRIFYKLEHFNDFKIEKSCLYQIHGSVIEKTSLVFTIKQYLRQYKEIKFTAFLEKIFRDYTILFIGYGMAEFELLDFLVTKFSDIKSPVRKHFLLEPYFKDEINIWQYHNYYFEDLNIQVIPYTKDSRGYRQLEDVLADWAKDIQVKSRSLIGTFDNIDEAIDNFEEQKVASILQFIKTNPSHRQYFFKKLESHTNAKPWFSHLKEQGYFQISEMPKQYVDSNQYLTAQLWDVLPYMLNLSKVNYENFDTKINNELLEFIDNVIQDGRDKKETYNYRTDRYLIILIAYLPHEFLLQKHFDFIKKVLSKDTLLISSDIKDKLLPRLIERRSSEKLLKLLDEIIFDYVTNEDGNGFKEWSSLMDDHLLQQIVERQSTEIFQLCGLKATDIAIRKVHKIISHSPDTFDKSYLRNIEDDFYYSNRDLHAIIAFIRNTLKIAEIADTKAIIESFLYKKDDIFKRIALYIIGVRYDDFSELLWSVKYNPVENYEIAYELFNAIRNNTQKLTNENVEQFIKWVEDRDFSKMKEKAENDALLFQKRKAYDIKGRLEVIKEHPYPLIKEKIDLYNQIFPEPFDAELQFKGFKFSTRSDIKEPDTTNQLRDLTNPEIVNYLNEFHEQDEFGQVNIEGIGYNFEKIIVENSNRFISGLDTFLPLKVEYFRIMLNALEIIWNQQPNINISSILMFIEQYIAKPTFKIEDITDKENNQIVWTIRKITDLIEKGCHDDGKGFDQRNLEISQKILLLCYPKVDFINDNNGDPINYLKSAKIFILRTLLLLELRKARISEDKETEKWNIKSKELFQRELDNKHSNELFVLLGMFLPNLNYLDKSWVEQNLDKIFPHTEDNIWKLSFNGYLAYYNEVYKRIYLKFKERGDYQKAIDFGIETIDKNLINHICIGYQAEWEKLEDRDSLIYQLIHADNTDFLEGIISFFSDRRREVRREYNYTQIKLLWKEIYEFIKDKTTEKTYHNIAASLNDFILEVPLIDDEIFEWLKLTAKCQADNWNYSFVKALLIHARGTDQHKYIGELYIEMLKSKVFPDYQEYEIIELIGILYEKGAKEQADQICNLYFEKGYYFLRHTYNQFNNIPSNE